MIREALLGILALCLLAGVIYKLPAEAAMIRALDLELHLHDLCQLGSHEACSLMSSPPARFKDRVQAATENLPGHCLYAGDDGVALRLKRGDHVIVADLSARALSFCA